HAEHRTGDDISRDIPGLSGDVASLHQGGGLRVIADGFEDQGAGSRPRYEKCTARGRSEIRRRAAARRSSKVRGFRCPQGFAAADGCGDGLALRAALASESRFRATSIVMTA